MKVVGLCGGSGSGKGTIAKLFSNYSIPTIDTDTVYRDLTSSETQCLRELTYKFGREIICDGKLDRKLLASIVFSDKTGRKLAVLNSVTHKHIIAKTRRLIAELRNTDAKFVLVDAPLLYESGFDKECDAVIAVISDTETRISRIMSRDGLSRYDACARIAAQKTNEWLAEHADYVIHNNGNLRELDTAVQDVMIKISLKR